MTETTGCGADRGRDGVLIVDDDPGVRRALARLVRSAGYDAVAYPTAEELLARASVAAAPACLILDVKLPGMSGLELHRTLAARGLHIPTIFISGHVDPEERDRAIPGEAVAFLPKPFLDRALLDALERAPAASLPPGGSKE